MAPMSVKVCSRSFMLRKWMHSKFASSYPNRNMSLAEEVKYALANHRPVVALESTILTHGMPYPNNIQMALSVERIIRENGATPATIALINGKVIVGLNNEQLEEIAANKSTALKVSRRDIASTINKGLVGGTTISATMVLAHMAGIKVFVSGGLGGVHRGGEVTMDVSADLTELGRTPVAVITSGVKSILDIGRTLEFLETQGVCVATYGLSTEFPAFFTSESGFHSACAVKDPEEAAALIHTTFQLQLQNGVLIAVPIPKRFELQGRFIEESIQLAVSEAESEGIKGRLITPYILKRVNELTAGKSLQSNIALIENNALVGAQIAVKLSELESKHNDGIAKNYNPNIQSKRSFSTVIQPNSNLTDGSSYAGFKPEPVVIGACNMDNLFHIQEDDVKYDGSTNVGKAFSVCGGVGRNLSDALFRLGTRNAFLTALGSDLTGVRIRSMCGHMDWKHARIVHNCSTASYAVVLNKKGDVILGIGDMGIHDRITPDYIMKNEDIIQSASMVIFDGNLDDETIKTICDLCRKHKRPVFYEPTDTGKAIKPFLVKAEDVITYVKPNLAELTKIYEYQTGKKFNAGQTGSAAFLENLANCCDAILECIPNIILTLGGQGLLFCTRWPLDDISARHTHDINFIKNSSNGVFIHLKPNVLESIKSLSGAGDCLAAGFIHGTLNHFGVLNSLRLGVQAAAISAQHYETVPYAISDLTRSK